MTRTFKDLRRCKNKVITVLPVFLTMTFAFTPFNHDAHVFTEGFITLSADFLDFGEVQTGESAGMSLQIHNGGADVLSVVYSSAVSEEFVISDLPDVFPAFSTVEIDIEFEPGQNLDFYDYLMISLSGTDSEIMVGLTGSGIFQDDYYTGTQNLWGEDLKNALADIIDNHTDLGYNSARDRMFDTIDNVDGTIEGVYSGIVINAVNRSEAQAQGFDTEHTWPRSLGADNSPPKSDLHHLYPTRSQFNSTRGNLPFGIVVNSNWPSGVPNSSDTDRGYNSSGVQVFEPRDIHKGDVARSMFYFSLRYNNPNNFLNDQEDVLRSWFYNDFVSLKEIDRNEAIYGYQNNRSPFVDHPEFLERISSLSSFSPPQAEVGTIAVCEGPVYFFSWHESYVIPVGNSGQSILNVTDTNLTLATFSVNITETQIQSGGSALIELTQVIDINGIQSGILQISSNDPAAPQKSVEIEVYNLPPGDANLDSDVDVLDIVLCVSQILGDAELSIPQFSLGDVNFDAAIDVLDIVMIVDWIISD